MQDPAELIKNNLNIDDFELVQHPLKTDIDSTKETKTSDETFGQMLKRITSTANNMDEKIAYWKPIVQTNLIYFARSGLSKVNLAFASNELLIAGVKYEKYEEMIPRNENFIEFLDKLMMDFKDVHYYYIRHSQNKLVEFSW